MPMLSVIIIAFQPVYFSVNEIFDMYIEHSAFFGTSLHSSRRILFQTSSDYYFLINFAFKVIFQLALI